MNNELNLFQESDFESEREKYLLSEKKCVELLRHSLITCNSFFVYVDGEVMGRFEWVTKPYNKETKSLSVSCKSKDFGDKPIIPALTLSEMFSLLPYAIVDRMGRVHTPQARESESTGTLTYGYFTTFKDCLVSYSGKPIEVLYNLLI